VGISNFKIQILQRKFKMRIFQREKSFHLQKEFKKLVTRYQVGAVDMDKLFLVFLEIYQQEEEALEEARKNITTDQLERIDIERNIVFRGFFNGVKSASNCFDEDVQQAAFRLNVLLCRYKNVTRRSCDQKTTVFYNLIQETTSSYSSDVDKVGLVPWTLQLESVNNAVDVVSKMYYDKVATKTGLQMKQVQLQIDAAYQQKADQVNALIKLKVALKFEEFVKCIDTRMNSYYNIVEQCHGKIKRDENKGVR